MERVKRLSTVLSWCTFIHVLFFPLMIFRILAHKPKLLAFICSLSMGDYWILVHNYPNNHHLTINTLSFSLVFLELGTHVQTTIFQFHSSLCVLSDIALHTQMFTHLTTTPHNWVNHSGLRGGSLYTWIM